MRPDIAASGATQRIPPPLHADLARQWLGYDFADPRQFEAEGVKGVQIRAFFAGHEQASQPAVAILGAQQSPACIVMRSERGENINAGHATARRAAATRRFSA